MLRGIALVLGLCGAFGLLLYLAYSGDTVPTKSPTATAQPLANYRALAKLSAIDFSFVSPQVGWLVLGNRQNHPDEGRILATRDAGKTWHVQSAMPASRVQFVDDHNGWGYLWWQPNPSITPTPKESSTACQCLIVTHDGGQSWQQLPPAPRYLQYFKFVNDHVGWGVTGTTGTAGFESGVFLTMDSGVSWQEVQLPLEIGSSPVALLGAKDERTSWLSYCSQAGCQQRDLAVTYDGGITWKSIGSPCGFPAEVTATIVPYFIAYFLSASEWWVLCSVSSQQDTSLYKTSDGGDHWLLLAGPNGHGTLPRLPPALDMLSPLGFGDIQFVNSNEGWLAIGGFPFVTYDGGVTWKDTRPSNVGADKVSFVDDSHGWVQAAGSLLSTDDGGATWHRIYPPEGK